MNPFEQLQNSTPLYQNQGVITATVIENVDEESLGRVKVRFNWLEEGEKSFWARVLTPMAGKEQGIYFLPEIEDEVLIAFLNQQIEYPVVIGSLWNGQNLPPQNNEEEENNIRQIRSRSGHELTFDDTKDKEKLTIVSSKEHKIEIDDKNETITIQSKKGKSILLDDKNKTISIKDKGGNTIIMEENKGIEIKSDGDISLDGMNITLKAGASLKLEGGAGLDLISDAITTIKGALVKIN